MKLKKRSYEMDMTSGSILPKVLIFALPLMLSSILQLLFNAADVIVVGHFADNKEAALAAVGSTGALINLIVNVFLGLSVGTNVIVARYIGARQYKETSEAVHTSITISLIGGVVLAFVGLFGARTFLSWMGSPAHVLPLATVYVQIYFAGMPFNMLYNFGAAVLRAIGDTRRPLVYLTLAGVINVLLNLLFVIVFRMGVAGVALATILSQAISATLVFICLMRTDGAVHLDLKKLSIKADKLMDIVKIGMPAGLQGAFFSLSNVLIQSTINSYGSTVMAGNTVAANLEGFIYVTMNAIYQAAITFTSQNFGAGKLQRIRRIIWVTLATVAVIGASVSGIALLFKDPLMSIYSDQADVHSAGAVRLGVVALTYFTCGLMDVLCGVLRGLGKIILPMIVSLMGACAFRIFWVYFILPPERTLETLRILYLSYPVSWVLTGTIHAICLVVVMRKLSRQYASIEAA